MTKIIKNELYRINKKILGSTSTIGDILFCVGQADKRYAGVYVFFNLRTGKQLVLSGKENVIESLREL